MMTDDGNQSDGNESEAWQLPGDRVLLRWFQSHVDAAVAAKPPSAATANANHPPRKVLNLRDSESYLDLLHRLQSLRMAQNPSAAPPLRVLPSNLALPSGSGGAAASQELLLARAAEVIECAKSLGVENVCISASDIVSGAPRANLLFTALLFEAANKLGLDSSWFEAEQKKAAAAEAAEAEAAAAVEAEAAAAAAAALAAEQLRLKQAKEAAEAEAARLAAAALERERLAAEQARQRAEAQAAAEAAATAAEAAERQRQLELLRAEQARVQREAAEAAAKKEADAKAAAELARKAVEAAAIAAKQKAERDAAIAAAAAAAKSAADAKAAADSKLDRKHSITSSTATVDPVLTAQNPLAQAAAAAAKAAAAKGKHRPSSVALLQAAAAAQNSSAAPKIVLKTATERNEERCLRMWINSVLAQDEVWVEDLFDDLRDGLVLLKVEQRLWADSPDGQSQASSAGTGLINWKQVETKFTQQTRLKCVSNCNYALDLGRTKLKLPGLSLATPAGGQQLQAANISGVDIADGGVKPILSVGWQLMRYHLRVMLNRLVKAASGDVSAAAAAATNSSSAGAGAAAAVRGVERDSDFDSVLLNWANKRVKNWAEAHPKQCM